MARIFKAGSGRMTALAAGVAAASALTAGVLFRWWKTRNGEDNLPAPALRHGGAPGPVGSTGSVRSAGRGGMRDPPTEWDEVDEAVDESFPASDPPALAKHVD